jgi:hypothetical protein
MQPKGVFLFKLAVFVDRMNSRDIDLVIHSAHNRQLSLHILAYTRSFKCLESCSDSLDFV